MGDENEQSIKQYMYENAIMRHFSIYFKMFPLEVLKTKMGKESQAFLLMRGSSTLGKVESSEIPTSFSPWEVIISGLVLNTGILSVFL